MTIAALIVSILIGAVACFAGYRVFRLFIAIMGAAVGGMIGYSIGGDQQALAILLAIILAVAFASLAFFIYKAGVALLGFLFGCGMSVGICGLIGVAYSFGTCLIIGLVCAVIAVFLNRYFIVIGTAFSGSTMVMEGIFSFTILDKLQAVTNWEEIIQSQFSAVPFIIILIVAIVGMIVQFSHMPKK